MEELILGKAKALFFNYGLKSISMDDLARDAGVSKKTVYGVVADKNELVMKVAHQLVQCFSDGLEHCRTHSKNAVAEVALQAMLPFAELTTISPSFFYDLEKFFPEAWQQVTQHREHGLLPHIRRNLDRGIAEGLYHVDIDLELTPQIRLQQLQSVLYPGPFTALQPDLQQLVKRLTRFYLQAITNSKGSKMIEQYLKDSNTKNSNEQEKLFQKH